LTDLQILQFEEL